MRGSVQFFPSPDEYSLALRRSREEIFTSNFTKDQYSVFRSKFNEQTTAVITSDPTGVFNPPQVVLDLIHTPGKLADTHVSGDEYIPYEFN
jgi:hypothetical protein